MIEFIAGLVIGATFSPFWMKVWEWVQPKITKTLDGKSKE